MTYRQRSQISADEEPGLFLQVATFVGAAGPLHRKTSEMKLNQELGHARVILRTTREFSTYAGGGGGLTVSRILSLAPARVTVQMEMESSHILMTQ